MAEEEFLYTCKEINTFERMLTDDGTILIKLFLSISKKEQKKRFDKLLQSKDTAWRVSKQDIKRNHSYDKYKEMMEQMLENTETVYAPWHIIEACDRRFATAKIFMTVISCIKEKMNMTKSALGNPTEKTMVSSSLSKVDLNLSYSKELYKKKLENLQKRLTVLHGELYRRKIPVILGFEGWDAGGKGGAIRRLTEAMDPRGYVVNPTAAPSGEEKNHHYLWRFWRNMPKDGHVAIFDRTWYGRVMVERIEGFCTPFEWQRAYQEINDMEASLAHHGAIVIKFWMHIDKDEQERRFRARMEDPDKNWKITDEDWRNREKWDLYEDAVNEMIIRTSTTYAPWVIVEGNNKYYARIKVLETVVNAIEKRLQK